MEIKPIPVIRAAYLNLFLDVLNESGRNYETDLQQFNLPTTLTDKPDAYVAYKAALLFMHWGACSTGIEDFGLRAASRLQVSDFDAELRSALLCAPTLEAALQTFCRLAKREQSPVRYWIVRERDEVRICSSLDALPLSSTDHCGEWLQIMSLLTIIRHFAGCAWMPATIAFQSQHEPGRHARRAFPRARFVTGQKETGIVFPASLLRGASAMHNRRQTAAVPPDGKSRAPGQARWNFPASLCALLQAYLDDGYPQIEFAAKIAGSSVRTLQRRLKQFDLSYSEVIKQARFEVAAHLLRDSDIKVIDASYAVGYNDPSNFARAFRRLTGVSPKQYRAASYAY